MSTSADRIYLYVPFEEKERAKALGARWDAERKCWYVARAGDLRVFGQWLDQEPCRDDCDFYLIASSSAYVAATRTQCWKCRAPTPVVCLYCADGTIAGERYEGFTVSNITAIDAALERQLERWPFLRFGRGGRECDRYLGNHCVHCDVLQQDYYMHCEPGGAFFTLIDAPSGAIELTPLTGEVRLTGDEGFEP